MRYNISMRYSIVMFLLRAILPIIARITVVGAENIPPKNASFIGVANHIGRLDPAIVYYLLRRRDIIILVAEKYKDHFWSRILAQAVDGIFVDRYNADMNAIRQLLRRLNKGGVVALAPEGTRSPTMSLVQGWDGASYIAAKSGLPILPVGGTGTGDKEVVERLKNFRRLDIKLQIGKVFRLPPLDYSNRDQQLGAYTEEIMCRIAAELPESYRGVYASHPRLQELLAEKGGVQYQPAAMHG